jgi:hypothetical protein
MQGEGIGCKEYLLLLLASKIATLISTHISSHLKIFPNLKLELHNINQFSFSYNQWTSTRTSAKNVLPSKTFSPQNILLVIEELYAHGCILI